METIRVSAIGVVGFVTQLTALDLFFKVSIGFLTCCYLTVKIFQMVKTGKDKKDE
jgi:hypothetical protein